MRFLQDVGTDVVGFEGDVYLDATTGALTDVASYRPESPPNGLSESESVDWQRDNIDLAATADQVMADGEQTFGEKADELLADPESLQKMVAPLSMITLANGQTMAEYVGFNLSTQQTPNRDQLIHVYRYMDGLLDGPDADISPTLFRETENVQVGEGGKVGRMGMQFAQDLAKMDADTANRMALSAADYASKTELSAVEHEQFLESLVTEYGLKGENQEFIDRAANYRAELAAETARLKVEAGLAEAAVKTMTSLEEVQMKQWVEINKMVFDPDDTVNDSAIRQQAIDAFNLEYADRKAFISNAVSELSSWEWSSSTAGTESGDGTDADSTGSDEPVGLLSSAPSVLYPSEVKPLGKLLSTAKNGNDSQFIQQIADGNDAEIFSSQIRLNGDIVNSIPGTTLYKESVGLTQSFLDTVKADNLSFGTVDDLLSTEGVSAVWSYSDKGWVSSVKDTPAFLKSLSGDIEDDRLYILFTDEGRIQVTGSSLKSGSITDAVVGSIEFWKPYLES
jgi:hypothetical protein